MLWFIAKSLFVLAVTSIIFSATFLFLDHQGASGKAATLGFFLLILGAVFYMLDLKNAKE